MGKRVAAKDVSGVSQLDWARLAMAIDCEGHIQIAQAVHSQPRLKSSRTHYEYINVVVSNTDVRLIDWIAGHFGGRVYVQARKKAIWKDAYRWHISCTQAAEILRGCLQYFVVKREQAELALALQATMQRCGVRGTPTTVIEQRLVLQRKLKALTMRGPQPIAEAG